MADGKLLVSSKRNSGISAWRSEEMSFIGHPGNSLGGAQAGPRAGSIKMGLVSRKAMREKKREGKKGEISAHSPACRCPLLSGSLARERVFFLGFSLSMPVTQFWDWPTFGWKPGDKWGETPQKTHCCLVIFLIVLLLFIFQSFQIAAFYIFSRLYGCNQYWAYSTLVGTRNLQFLLKCSLLHENHSVCAIEHVSNSFSLKKHASRLYLNPETKFHPWCCNSYTISH